MCSSFNVLAICKRVSNYAGQLQESLFAFYISYLSGVRVY
jgi:hypothetical protein